MKKKIIITIIALILLSGCSIKEKDEKKKTKEIDEIYKLNEETTIYSTFPNLKFIKENGLTANCYFVIHKFKIIDKDLGKNVEYVSGLVVAPPPYEYAGVLYRTIKPWYNQ